MPYKARYCEVCQASFTPPSFKNKSILSTGDNHLRLCAPCRREVKAVLSSETLVSETPVLHSLAAPLTQIVMDLETWGLDRGWGVTLVGSFLIHGGPAGVVKKTLSLRDYAPWQAGKRSDDKDLAYEVFDILKTGQIVYAHNGEFFDIRWLRSLALKYGLEMPRVKLIDPAQISRRKYLIGRNSLEALADFLGLKAPDGTPLVKMHIEPEIWKGALLDNDDDCWFKLKQRCESDVLLLNGVASAVTGDVGMIDYTGSSR